MPDDQLPLDAVAEDQLPLDAAPDSAEDAAQDVSAADESSAREEAGVASADAEPADVARPQQPTASSEDAASQGSSSAPDSDSVRRNPAERLAPAIAFKGGDDRQTTGRGNRQRGNRSAQGGARPRSQAADAGADLERRVGRTEFSDGALVRLRVPVRIDADSGRAVLTDIDVLALDVDGRLRLSQSILECKSGKGQAGEPDRLLWLAGLQKYLNFARAVLVRQSVSKRGRTLARALDLGSLDMKALAARESAHTWVPERFGHIDGAECIAAETRTDTQLKGLGHIPADLVSFLRHDTLRSPAHANLRAIAALGRAADRGGVLPNPTRFVLAGHAVIALLVAALADAGTLDEMTPDDLLERTRRALVTGNPDDDQVMGILARADELMTYSAERLHVAYQDAGSKRLQVSVPSLVDAVATPPTWVPFYVDLVEKLRANPATARQMLQTVELAVFEGLVGGTAHEAPAFDHLFGSQHHYLLNVATRCLSEIAGASIADALQPALALNFRRGSLSNVDRDQPPTS